MKKLFISAAVVATFGLVSCGGGVEDAADDFCACTEKEDMKEMQSCMEDWEKEYEDLKGNDDDKEEFEKLTKECSEKMMERMMGGSEMPEGDSEE